MSDDVAVVGAGMIPFGERFELGYYDMIGRAYKEAKSHVDHGIDDSDVDAAWLGTAYGTLSNDAEIVSGARLSGATGLKGIPITRVENACATGSDAVRNAAAAVQAGQADVAVVVGAEKMRDKPTDEFMKTVTNRPTTRGMTAPAFFAMYAQRHMQEYGTTREQMAEVAVKNHANGTKCEYSHFDFEVDAESVLDAPRVSYPFGLYDCSPQTDGAACLVLASEDVADSYTDDPVWVRGTGNSTVPYDMTKRDDYLEAEPTIEAASQAYEMAGLGPDDVDVVEQHDCFTFTELLNMEDLGFCEKGEGGEFVASGATRLDGDLPVNPSGGLKAKGHPIGATGVAQICELVWQLRNEVGERQVPDATTGLQHNLAGSLAVSNVTVVSTERD
ncbi:thiolase family protein [Halorientalis regularis]|jgi:acetyl-CoA C-acetyltransferase|uniref:Acetyl-CoA C-acetyltransferase n=1 Tax=Halorientalis regularis TaxID=660518 RepID=A0A1G7NB03_9EURY|nr:thiolase family protein [Halorientalis regularis]SDF71091.1 acetyl-CoA C-acetyltransferase [Halorientalis regularis]